MGWLASIGVGVGVMAGHGALRMLTHRLALRQTSVRSFLLFELGGLGVRMVLVFAAVAAVLLHGSVQTVWFVGTVLTLLILSMIVETRFIYREMDSGTLTS